MNPTITAIVVREQHRDMRRTADNHRRVSEVTTAGKPRTAVNWWVRRAVHPPLPA